MVTRGRLLRASEATPVRRVLRVEMKAGTKKSHPKVELKLVGSFFLTELSLPREVSNLRQSSRIWLQH